MGAWGLGPFDNDDASDWAYDFDDADEATGLRILTDALDLGVPGEYIEAPEGANAVAAAAVVSWLHHPGAIGDSPYGEAAATWVRTVRPSPTVPLAAAALMALDRVRSDDSELAELWAESEDAAWGESVSRSRADFERGAESHSRR